MWSEIRSGQSEQMGNILRFCYYPAHQDYDHIGTFCCWNFDREIALSDIQNQRQGVLQTTVWFVLHTPLLDNWNLQPLLFLRVWLVQDADNHSETTRLLGRIPSYPRRDSYSSDHQQSRELLRHVGR